MKRIFMLMALIAIVITSSSAPRDMEQASQIAKQLAKRHGFGSDEPKLKSEASPNRGNVIGEPFTVDQTYYYIFNYGNAKGYAIVSGDDTMPEIVGYATEGDFDENTIPESMSALLSAYRSTVDKVMAGDKQAMQNVLQLAAIRKAADGTSVEPLLGNIAWNQNIPFNNECPMFANGTHAVTGCNATAAAQIMKYYSHPKALCNDIPAYTSYSGQKYEAIPAKDRTYNWNKMIVNYNTGYSTTQAAEVARLMSDVGKASKTDYGTSGSSAAYAETKNAFVNYFGYDKDLIQLLSRSNFSLAQWIDIIKNELHNGRPVYYAGQSKGGGHSFVCDGYDSELFFHINWGWGGQANGYFDISILNPYSGGIGGSSTSDGFDMNMEMIIGIQPDNGVTDAPLVDTSFNKMFPTFYQYGNIVIDGERETADGTFKVILPWNIFNYGDTTFEGSLAVVSIDDNGKLTVIKQLDGLKFNIFQGFRLDNADYRDFLTVDYAFPVGVSRLSMAEKVNGGDWKLVVSAMSNSVIFEATETTLSVFKKNLEAEISPTELTIGEEGVVKMKITNNTGYDYYGRCRYYADYGDGLEDTPGTLNTIPVGLDDGDSMEWNAPLIIIGECDILLKDDDGNELVRQHFKPSGTPVPRFVFDGCSIEMNDERKLIFTTLGLMSVPVLHNEGSPVLKIRIRNNGVTGVFHTAINNKWNPNLLLFDTTTGYNITTTIESGTVAEFAVPSADSGEGIVIWNLFGSQIEGFSEVAFIDKNMGVKYTNGSFFIAYNDGVSGIKGVEYSDEEKEMPVYTLQGVKTDKPTKSGIYVIGRKKVLIK